MTRGRKPLPTQLKLMAGNPGRHPLNDSEPQPESAIPDCPPHLDALAAEKWHEITPDLLELGILTRIDGDTLAAYCQAYSRWAAAENVIGEKGLTFETEKGMVRQRPEVAIAKESMRLMREFASEFGLTPSSRSRLHVEKQERADSVSTFARKRS